ncbi:putative calcium-binding protein CML30 [Canna indica]|uniref:Calcium-binding protein CML30 n=1 Tax=Canna indica TaxID=4628 RepID=A0AAQ3QFU1_9LILI|nr:putative calcium-binding protein CML30 [Canna indica]
MQDSLEFLFLHTVFNWVFMMLEKFSLGSVSFLYSSILREEQPMNCRPSNLPRSEAELSREEVEMVMCKVGLQEEQVTSEDVEVLRLFEEKEPSLEEVKAAFCVFDENSDGFVDAVELQRVLLKLGFSEGRELDACRRMITIYDEDHDGRIGFTEFVKLMEINLC